MQFIKYKLALSLALFLNTSFINVSLAQDPCIEQVGSCACLTATGWINLELLDSKDKNSPRFDGFTDYVGNTYSYNPCSSYSSGNCQDVAACQNVNGGVRLGTQDTASFGTNTMGDITLNYQAVDAGVSKSLIVALKCNLGIEGVMTSTGEGPPNVFDHALESKYACPGVGPAPSSGGSSGLSPGSILLIVCFVFLIGYITGGILFNKFYLNKSGTDLAPNKTFWITLPGLAKDGAVYTYHTLRGLIGGDSGGGKRAEYDEF